ncbi:hypothetical protein M9C84_06425 [SAR86 cluster bacterium]|jgi:hypothetical protein|nr:hypothetical protein M9C84_06425 [SAR86 cluster bacterium]
MALYTFVGIFCSFIAVDITKSLISKKASGFFYFLNLLAVASLSIVLANLLGLAWLMLYSEFFVKAWFPEMYQFGQMLIAFLGASIWMSIFFVPLFHYMHIKDKVQYKKWIYSAFLIVIIALPLSFAFQNGKSAENNLPSDSNNLSFDAICFTGIENMYLLAAVYQDSIVTYYFFRKDNKIENDVYIGSRTSHYENVKVIVDKDNNLTFASGQNTYENQNFELAKKREAIFYESSNEFIKLNGKCVLDNDGDYSDEVAVARFLKSQDRTNK